MAETLIVDYSFARPDLADVAQVGYRGIVRYLAPAPNRKIVEPDEIQAAHAAGLAVLLVWESFEQAASRTGYAGGHEEGAEAIAMAQALGYPAGCAIYFAWEDPRKLPVSAWGAVFDYGQAIRDLDGPYQIGGYGSQALIEAGRERGLLDFGWQVEGWSDSVSPLCHLYQRSNGRSIDYPGTDENVVLADDYGAWMPPGFEQPEVADPVPTVTPPPPEEDDDMASPRIRLTDHTGTVYLVNEDAGIYLGLDNKSLPLVDDEVKAGRIMKIDIDDAGIAQRYFAQLDERRRAG